MFQKKFVLLLIVLVALAVVALPQLSRSITANFAGASVHDTPANAHGDASVGAALHDTPTHDPHATPTNDAHATPTDDAHASPHDTATPTHDPHGVPTSDLHATATPAYHELHATPTPAHPAPGSASAPPPQDTCAINPQTGQTVCCSIDPVTQQPICSTTGGKVLPKPSPLPMSPPSHKSTAP